MKYYIFSSIFCFLFTLSIVLIHPHESALSLYFILFYSPLFVPLLTMCHSLFAFTHCDFPTCLLPLDMGLQTLSHMSWLELNCGPPMIS